MRQMHETWNLVANVVPPCRSESHVGHVTTNFTFTGVIGSCRQPLWGLGTGKVVNKRFYEEAHPGGPYQNVHGTVKTGFYLTSGYFLRLDNSNFFWILLKVRELSEVDCSTNEKCGPTICKKNPRSWKNNYKQRNFHKKYIFIALRIL